VLFQEEGELGGLEEEKQKRRKRQRQKEEMVAV